MNRKTIPGTESHSAIEEQAADWLARRDSGDWSVDEQLRFERWLDASPANRVAFLRLDHVWQRSRRLQALGAGRQAGDIPAPGQWEASTQNGGSRAVATGRWRAGVKTNGNRPAANSRQPFSSVTCFSPRTSP